MKKITEIPKLISYLIFHWKAMGQLHKLWTANEYQQLISFCNLMLDRNSTDYLAFYYRGLANEMLNQFDLAIEDLIKSEAALKTYKLKAFGKEYFIQIPIQLSRVYIRLQDKEKALSYADNAVEADPHKIGALTWRASLKEDFGDYIGASEDLNEALKRQPKDKSLIKLRDRLTYIIIEDRKEMDRR